MSVGQPRAPAQKPPMGQQPASPDPIHKPASSPPLASVCYCRYRKLRQSSPRGRPDKPIPRTPTPTAARRSLPPKNGLAICRQGSKRSRKPLNLKEPPRKAYPPTNGLRPRRQTKPTICSTSRRKSCARSRLPPRAARKQPDRKDPEEPIAQTPSLVTPLLR